jgi:DNA polymerase-3 subunit delta'
MLSFSDILGQEPAIDTLVRAYRADRLAHGLIFAGPVGVGKATTAKALAALFLCQKPTLKEKGDAVGVSCGSCDSCRAIEVNSHPDYHVITRQLIRYHDKTGKSKGIDMSIEVIRKELVERAGLKASLGHGKVFVIEEADSMTTQAQNAMLKTLEEPADRTLIILLTDQPGALLPTIRSRCQMIRFAPLEESMVCSELEKRDVKKHDAADAAAVAEGSLGLALQWIGDGVIEQARDLSAQIDALLAGRVPEGLEGWFKRAADAYAEKQLEKDELGSKDQATREGLTLYLRLAASHLRRAMQSTSDPSKLDAICAGIDAIARAEQYLWANVSIPLLFQQLTLCWEREMAAQAG